MRVLKRELQAAGGDTQVLPALLQALVPRRLLRVGAERLRFEGLGEQLLLLQSKRPTPPRLTCL